VRKGREEEWGKRFRRREVEISFYSNVTTRAEKRRRERPKGGRKKKKKTVAALLRLRRWRLKRKRGEGEEKKKKKRPTRPKISFVLQGKKREEGIEGAVRFSSLPFFYSGWKWG